MSEQVLRRESVTYSYLEFPASDSPTILTFYVRPAGEVVLRAYFSILEPFVASDASAMSFNYNYEGNGGSPIISGASLGSYGVFANMNELVSLVTQALQFQIQNSSDVVPNLTAGKIQITLLIAKIADL